MPKLIVIKSDMAVREYPLDSSVSIGRHESNQIKLDEERASRQHCRVWLERGNAMLEDLDSANGVYVNGLKVKSAVLNHNDRITVGNTSMIFNNDAEPARGGDTVVLNDVSPAARIDADKPGRPFVAVADAEKSVAPKPVIRKRVQTRSHSSGMFTIVALLALAAALKFLWPVLNPPSKGPEPIAAGGSKPAEKIDLRPAPAPAKIAEPVSVPALPAEAPREPVSVRMASAMALRDRAMASGNFLGARAALRSFLTGLNEEESRDPAAAKARDQLEETEKVTGVALELSLEQAKTAIEARRFQTATQRCTSVMSNDPKGPLGARAKELLERMDERTAPLAAGASAKARDALKRGNLDEARSALQSALGELAGTHWAGDVSALNLQIVMASSLLDEMEAARAKRAASSQDVSVSIATKKINGKLAGLKGLQARIKSGPVEAAVSLASFDTAELNKLVDVLDLEDRHAELGCLWAVLGRADAALAQSELALKNPGRTPLAACFAGMMNRSKNLHLYDFSTWRQQADWDAISGSWLTQDEKYMLESSDGGETVLKESSLGGPFPLKDARLIFDLELKKADPGWFFACDFGSTDHGVSIQFSANEVVLAAKSGSQRSDPFAWKHVPARIELSIEGEDAVLKIDAKPATRLTVAGLSAVKGTVGFQARLCQCSLDNLILRSATP